MLDALGAWLHCRHADLHAGKDTDHYASTEPPHELTEKEIRAVLDRISDCDILFTPGQSYVSWAVRQLCISVKLLLEQLPVDLRWLS